MTGSLDKTIVLWRLEVTSQICARFFIKSLAQCSWCNLRKVVTFCFMAHDEARPLSKVHVLSYSACTCEHCWKRHVRQRRALQDAIPLDSSHVSSAGVSEVTRLTPSGAPVFSLAVDGAAPGSNPAAPDDRQQVLHAL